MLEKSYSFELVDPETVIQEVTDFLIKPDEGNSNMVHEIRKSLNQFGIDIVKNNQNTQYLPRITELIEHLDKLRNGVSRSMKIDSLEFQKLKTPLRQNGRKGLVVELDSVMTARALLTKEDGERMSIVNALCLGIKTNREIENIPWGLDIPEKHLRKYLEEANLRGNYTVARLWDYIVIYEKLLDEFNKRIKSKLTEEELPQCPLILMTDSRLDREGQGVIGSYDVLGRGVVKEIEENKKKVMKIISPYLRDPKKMSGYNRIMAIS